MKCLTNLRSSVLSTTFLSALLCAAPAFAAQFFVAPTGSDASPGTRLKPFASPLGARDAVRAALKRGEPCEVVLRAGNYELSAPLELGAEDSGSAAKPVVWRAADGESVRLSAGRSISGWKPVSDPQVLERLDPGVRGRVLQVDLKAQSITDYGEMSGGFSQAGSTGIELFLDDAPAHVSRYPNTGFIPISQVLGATPINVGGTKGTKEGVFQVDDPHVARWVGEKDARVLGYWFWDWADQRQSIASIDPATRTLTLAGEPHAFGYRKGQYFYAFNLLSEIDAPGEWFLDRQSGIAYVLPLGKAAPQHSLVTMLPNAVKMEGASHITLSHLIIEGARETAVTIRNGVGCTIVGCTIRNSGSWAVRVEGGSTCSVRGSDITGTGDGGVSLEGGERKSLTPSNHSVENCHIHDYSRWNRTYRAGVNLTGVGNRAIRNLIDHAPHEAISFSGNDHVIEGNEIHNVCDETNDAGAIYAGRDWTMRGHVIRNNFLHDIYGREAKGANGVYLDDNFSSATIEGNIFQNTMRAIHLGGGRDHQVQNNLFIDCPSALHIDARGLGWRADGFDDLKQKLEAMPYKTQPWSTRYPKLPALLNDEPMAPKGIVVAHNVIIGSNWDDIEKKALPFIAMRDNLLDAPRSLLFTVSQSLGITAHIPVGAIPRTRGDARFLLPPSTWAGPNLIPDASFKAIGFTPIPVDRIGLYASPERASWPVVHQVDVQAWPTSGAGSIAARTEPPLSVARAVRPPTVDGVVAPDEYPGESVALAETPSRDKIAANAGRAWLSHDAQRLYIAVQVPLSKPQLLVSKGDWGAADGLEIALRRDGKTPGQTFVLQGFPDGRANASTDAGASPAASEALLKASRYAAKVGADSWTAEWSIPLKEAGVGAAPGAVLGFNIGVRRVESDEWIAWTGTGAQNWKLAGAGRLVLR